jgi:hypothetical protein
MSTLRVRADQIQKGDVLYGYVVGAWCDRHAMSIPNRQVLSVNGFPIATLPFDAVVEVERPEPTLTITVELTSEESSIAEAMLHGDLTGPHPAELRIMDKVGAAVRAAKGDR